MSAPAGATSFPIPPPPSHNPALPFSPASDRLSHMDATVLIVDDEKHTREGLRQALEDDFDVYIAADRAEAMELLKNERIDVMLTDLRLGADDGMQLIEAAVALPQAPVVIMMTAYGSVDTADTIDTADLSVVGDSTVASDQFGWASRFVGDVDGDGVDDLVSSAWLAGTNNNGKAYLFLGGTTPTSVSSAFATFGSTGTNNYAGFAVDGGDVDGDGLADVMVSAYGRSSTAGSVGLWKSTAIGGGAEIISTDASLFITGVTAGDYLGYSAAVAPDLDGDGLGDLILGAPAAGTTTTGSGSCADTDLVLAAVAQLADTVAALQAKVDAIDCAFEVADFSDLSAATTVSTPVSMLLGLVLPLSLLSWAM